MLIPVRHLVRFLPANFCPMILRRTEHSAVCLGWSSSLMLRANFLMRSRLASITASPDQRLSAELQTSAIKGKPRGILADSSSSPRQ